MEELLQLLDFKIKTAMLSKDVVTKLVLRALKSDLINASKSAKGSIDHIAVIQKFIKQRQTTANIFNKANEPDKANDELNEAKIVTQFLPAQKTEAEIKKIVDTTISLYGFSTIKDMGKLMKELKQNLQGSADASLLAKLCKQALV